MPFSQGVNVVMTSLSGGSGVIGSNGSMEPSSIEQPNTKSSDKKRKILFFIVDFYSETKILFIADSPFNTINLFIEQFHQ